MNQIEDDKQIRELKSKIILAAKHADEGHIPSAYSILDILYCLYILLPRVSNIDFRKEDVFVLSKGHASLALYAILEQALFIGPEWAETFGDFNSEFGGHPDMCKISGVSASTGSLGHGLPFAIGKVLAKRINRKKSKIFCLIGDGELNEGTIWESLLLASHHKLSELTLIVDSNKTSERALALGNIESKLESFDFLVKRIDGHSHNSILEGLTNFSNTKPIALIAQTIKGFGIKEMENNPAWHHAVPSEDELDRFLIELE